MREEIVDHEVPTSSGVHPFPNFKHRHADLTDEQKEALANVGKPSEPEPEPLVVPVPVKSPEVIVDAPQKVIAKLTRKEFLKQARGLRAEDHG